MKKSWKIIIPLLLALTLFLSACGGGADTPDDNGDNGDSNGEDMEMVGDIELPYPQLVDKEGDTVGGTLNVALVASAPFEGIFNSFLYENAVDAELMGPMWGGFVGSALMKTGEDREIIDGGYVDVEFDKDEKTATYKIEEDLTWSDGEPVTAEDFIYVYETIGHPDYTGIRYDGDYRNVVGMEEYHDGEADSISGLNKIDDKTLEVSFKEFYPGILWGAGLTYNAEPAHYLGDIPVDELESHDKVRKEPLSYGPFVISNIVPGESVEYEPNPHWFGEEPKVEKIEYKRTNPDTIVEALESGSFDIVGRINVDEYENYKDLENIELVSSMDNAYGYIGFKHGKWNADDKEVEVDPDKKMSDVNLRKAIAYAMNNDEIAQAFYNDLRISANALITPYHLNFWHQDLEGYECNPEKAEEILDEAGYEYDENEEYRLDPDGNELTINLLSMSGGDIAEPLAEAYIQDWKEVGLNVQLQNGRLVDVNAFYDMVEDDNEDIDMYMGAWGTGSNPDPSGLYGRFASFNYPRFASEENDELLAAIASSDAFAEEDGEGALDNEYMQKAYQDWQEYMRDEVVVAPTHYRIRLTALNNRVNYFDDSPVNDWGWEKIGLLSEEPEKAQ